MSTEALECCHETTEIRQRTDSLGRAFFKRQCLACGRAVGDAISRRDVPADVKPWDEELEAATCAAAAEMRPVLREEKRMKWWSWYAEYLKTAIWEDKRSRVLERDGHLCQACRRTRASECHHLTYRHVGDEPLFDLIAVCHRCHEKLTEQDRSLTGGTAPCDHSN